jgi:hypothetical protein
MIAQAIEKHIHPLPRERARDGKADAACRARDDGCLAH